MTIERETKLEEVDRLIADLHAELDACLNVNTYKMQARLELLIIFTQKRNRLVA